MTAPYYQPYAPESRLPEYTSDETRDETGEWNPWVGPEGWGEVVLDGIVFPIIPPARYSNLASFAPKLVIGDYTEDSDDLFSSRIYSNFSGGGQIDRENSGSDQERFWYATLNTRHPHLLSLNRWVETIPPPAGRSGSVVRPLGDLNGSTWIAWGTAIHRWDPTTQTIVATATATLPIEPVGKPRAYDGKLWIPTGTGIVSFDGTSVSANNLTVPAVAVEEFDNKLAALCVDGSLRILFTGVWDNPGAGAVVRSGTPRALFVFTPSGDPILHVVTSAGVWAYDPDNKLVYLTSLRFPAHPYAGRAATDWQSDAFVTTGVGVFLYNGGQIAARGLDRDDGLPAEFRGAIIDLQPEFNALYAMVQGAPVANTATEGVDLVTGLYHDDDVTVTGVTARGSLMYYTGFGWHALWVSPDATGLPSWVIVAAPAESSPDAYGLFWGYGDRLYRCPLPSSFSNPKQGMRSGTDQFAESGYLEQGSFSFNMRSWPKTASHGILRLAECPAGCSVSVSYQTDDAMGWTPMGTATEVGATIFQIGPEMPELPGVGRGITFDDIRILVEMRRDPANRRVSPIMESFSLKLVKEPMAARSWEFSIPLPNGNEPDWKGNSGTFLSDTLDRLTRPGRFISLLHEGRTYRVRVAYVSGTNSGGGELARVRRLTAVEVAPTIGGVLTGGVS